MQCQQSRRYLISSVHTDPRRSFLERFKGVGEPIGIQSGLGVAEPANGPQDDVIEIGSSGVRKADTPQRMAHSDR
jgi:hypothetical protein